MNGTVYRTDVSNRLVKEPLQFSNSHHVEMNVLRIYPSETRQTMLGFGGAFTEASAYTWAWMKEKKEEAIKLYFGKEGNCYNFCRTHIQSCDFALDNYAYVENGDMASFTVERDEKYLLPFIKAALDLEPDIKLLASPWSPPAFMKTNGEMNHGGRLKQEYRSMWADMVVEYIREYKKRGIEISRLTVQNEPKAVQIWDSCIYTGKEEGEFVARFLRPALNAAGFSHIKIGIWDHNKDCILDRVDETMSVENASESIDAVAFHWYSGDHFEALQAVKEKYPEKELIFTEGCVEYSRFDNKNQVKNAEMYAHDMIGNINSGMQGYIDWNMFLDEQGGPNHVRNFCDAPVMYNATEDRLDVKLSYYYIGHFSRFVKPGAKRVLVSRYTGDLEACGFCNPDKERVMVILNRSEEAKSFQIYDGDKIAGLEIQPHSIVTVCWQE